MAYEQPEDIIARLTMTFPPGYDLSLDRIKTLLEKLGNPECDIPPVIHVAGTNGKGSTVALMRSILEAAGYAVHVHTSPHLCRYHERFRIATAKGHSAYVNDDRLSQALLRVERVNNGQDITVFELLTAVTFVLFSSNPADYTLLEVGLGGRLDATNVIPPPLMSVITPIGLDHQGFLGDTIEQIAAEKAGIIKQGVPVCVGDQYDNRVRDMIDFAAARANAPVFYQGQDFQSFQENGRLVYQDEEGLMDLRLPRLQGQHQIINAGLAIAALRKIGLDLPHKIIDKGLQNVVWPGRMQQLKEGHLVKQAPDGSELWLDGGHNPHAGRAIASLMADLHEQSDRPLFLISALLNTKDPSGYFEPFSDLARHCFTVPLTNTENGIAPEDLFKSALAAGLSSEPVDSLEDALLMIKESWLSDIPPRILICGSLYLVGEALLLNGTPPK